MLLMSVLCWVAANASAQGRYTVEKASVVYVDNSGSTLSLNHRYLVAENTTALFTASSKTAVVA